MKSKKDTPSSLDILKQFLPVGLLDYFDLVGSESLSGSLFLFLEEKQRVPSEFKHLHLHSKGFMDEIQVQDFPIRGKAVYLGIKKRRWEDPKTNKIYTRDWSLVASGTRITAEFGGF